MRLHCLVVALLVCAAQPSLAAPLRVVATGDSQTKNYSPRLAAALAARGITADVSAVASGGATSATYTGQIADPHASPPVAHDFVADALASDPDIVLFMLGVNDAFQNRFDQFTADISSVFDRLATATNSRGRRPKVIVATNIPVLDNPTDAKYAAADALLDSQFNPWLKSQALEHGFALLDLNRRIQNQTGYQNWYSDDGATPGHVHLWGTDRAGAGYNWMADQFARAIRADMATVPEPSTLRLMIAAALAVGFVALSRRN